MVLLRVAVLLLCLIGLAAPAWAGKRVALVIGNSAYEGSGRLENPANDARALEAALKALKFDVLLGLDVTARGFADLLLEFSRRLKGADVGMFFFAGHGIQINDRNYLVPVDARLDNEFAIKREAFDALDVIELMEANALVNIVMLDACRNNPLAEGLRSRSRSSGRSLSVGQGLARMAPTRGGDTLIFYAAEPGQVAEDGKDTNSPFTRALLKHLATPGTEVEVMLKRVTADVRAATSDRQRPERLSKLTVEFYFNDQKVSVTVTPETDKGAAGSALATPREPAVSRETGEAALAWAAVKDSKDVAELQAFLRRYPQSFYADLAYNRLEKLDKASPTRVVAAGAPFGGRYVFAGTTPTGSRYRGKAMIWKDGEVWRMQWRTTAGESYEGKGELKDRTFTVWWGDQHPVIYRIEDSGKLDGTWADGKGFETLTPEP